MRNVASVCLEIGYPTLASVPHTIINGYKNVLAVTVETDYSFPLADKVHTKKLNFYACAVDRRNLHFNQRWKLKYGFACPHRSRPTLLILLRLLLRHLQQLLKLLQLHLLPRRRPRKNLKSQMMTWVLVCLTKTNVIMNQ